jgi:hypothetical protein
LHCGEELILLNVSSLESLRHCDREAFALSQSLEKLESFRLDSFEVD